MSHHRTVCEHGTVITQCRCMAPKVDRVVPCPFPDHSGAQDVPEATDAEIARLRAL